MAHEVSENGVLCILRFPAGYYDHVCLLSSHRLPVIVVKEHHSVDVAEEMSERLNSVPRFQTVVPLKTWCHEDTSVPLSSCAMGRTSADGSRVISAENELRIEEMFT